MGPIKGMKIILDYWTVFFETAFYPRSSPAKRRYKKYRYKSNIPKQEVWLKCKRGKTSKAASTIFFRRTMGAPPTQPLENGVRATAKWRSGVVDLSPSNSTCLKGTLFAGSPHRFSLFPRPFNASSDLHVRRRSFSVSLFFCCSLRFIFIHLFFCAIFNVVFMGFVSFDLTWFLPSFF